MTTECYVFMHTECVIFCNKPVTACSQWHVLTSTVGRGDLQYWRNVRICDDDTAAAYDYDTSRSDKGHAIVNSQRQCRGCCYTVYDMFCTPS